jgi:beta-N-acetylhexosaminidase
MSAIEAMRLHGAAIGAMLREVGINVNCAPMLDLAHSQSHPIIAERALGGEPMQVAALGRAWLDGMRSAGVTGIVKHMPGHGRASVDSHVGLPVVAASAAELEADIEPFRSLSCAPIAMTAHVVFSAWESELPATLSPKVIAEVIRGRIGFAGLLLSDDIVMSALTGPAPERAQAALRAGCDLVLHCSGELAEMQAVAAALPEIGVEARERLDRAVAWTPALAEAANYGELAARRDALLAYA